MLALGFFDGMHRAHVALLKETIRLAEGPRSPKPAMVTSSTHVLSFLKKTALPASGLSLCDKQAVAEQTRGFRDVLRPRSRPTAMVADAGAATSHRTSSWNKMKWRSSSASTSRSAGFGAGNVEALCKQPQFSTLVIEERVLYKAKIGSTRIREALRKGKMGLAAHLLEHPYVITGTVVRGRGRGPAPSDFRPPTSTTTAICFEKRRPLGRRGPFGQNVPRPRRHRRQPDLQGRSGVARSLPARFFRKPLWSIPGHSPNGINVPKSPTRTSTI
ncbi:MAG: hypothetical protein MZU79_05825 [Anaerotruncus sp.]|nr:hypothetical protein [Anaerotruncus sp.]